MDRHFFTSESVTEGHPDKVCDQISDAVLDAILAQDAAAHVACETIATTGMVLVMGEISTSCYVDIPRIARQVMREIGYDGAGLCVFLFKLIATGRELHRFLPDALQDSGKIGCHFSGFLQN